MTDKRKVEVFSAGCGLCDDAIELVQEMACASCEMTVHDMRDIDVVRRARSLGVTAVPAVVVNGRLVSQGAQRDALSAAGVGRPL